MLTFERQGGRVFLRLYIKLMIEIYNQVKGPKPQPVSRILEMACNLILPLIGIRKVKALSLNEPLPIVANTGNRC